MELLAHFIDAVDRLYAGLSPTDGRGQAPLPRGEWERLEEIGLPRAMLPEAAGGVGLSWSDAAALVRAAARHPISLPLAESLLGNWLLWQAGLEPATGPVAVAPVHLPSPYRLACLQRGYSLEGEEQGVPWAGAAGRLVLLAQADGAGYVLDLDLEDCEIAPSSNLGGEPRDRLRVRTGMSSERMGELRPTLSVEDLFAIGAAFRTAQMSGAIERVVEMTVDYARQRVQFGRPIGSFQVVQHYLARMAAESAAAAASAAVAAEALAPRPDALFVGAGKVRAGEAAAEVAALAHQIHGAMGFTREHPLHLFTTRLQAWRQEFGGEDYWARQIGQRIAALGPDRVWPALTGARPA